MKKMIFGVVLVVSLLVALSASVVYAGSDQVRGENGQGTVNQVQIQDPPPFQ